MALAAALQPRQNPNGTWAFHGSLRTVKLGRHGITDEGARALAAALLEPRENPDGSWAVNRAVTSLRLYGNSVGDEGAKSIAAALEPRRNPDGSWAFNSDLRLDLEGNNIGDEGWASLVAALRPRLGEDGGAIWPDPEVAHDFRDWEGGDAKAEAIAELLLAPVLDSDGAWVFNRAMDELDLFRRRGDSVGPDGARALAAALAPKAGPGGSWAFNGWLEEINLRGNSIGDEGAEAIAASLEPRQNPDGSWAHHSSLREVDLSGNGIASAGWTALATALRPRVGPDGTAFQPSLGVHNFGGFRDWSAGDAKPRAIAEHLLAPTLAPNGTWVFNEAMRQLDLGCGLPGGPPLAPRAAALPPDGLSLLPACLQTRASRRVGRRRWRMPLLRAAAQTANGSSIPSSDR